MTWRASLYLPFQDSLQTGNFPGYSFELLHGNCLPYGNPLAGRSGAGILQRPPEKAPRVSKPSKRLHGIMFFKTSPVHLFAALLNEAFKIKAKGASVWWQSLAEWAPLTTRDRRSSVHSQSMAEKVQRSLDEC